jgi:hypothetical protein
MSRLGRAIFSVVTVLSLVWTLASAHADQAFQRLMPLLVDLDGWQGKKPDGMSMEMPNGSMTTATREYQKGPARVNASVMLGQVAAGALAPMQAGMNITTIRVTPPRRSPVRFWWRSTRTRCSACPITDYPRKKR